MQIPDARLLDRYRAAERLRAGETGFRRPGHVCKDQRLMASALILGGAGFIGSNICRHLAARGFHVIAVDGLMPRTSGNATNLASATNKIEFIPDCVEQVKAFADLLSGHDIVVDAMGWTSHLEAFD